mgnify:CR=1 FL=1
MISYIAGPAPIQNLLKTIKKLLTKLGKPSIEFKYPLVVKSNITFFYYENLYAVFARLRIDIHHIQLQFKKYQWKFKTLLFEIQNMSTEILKFLFEIQKISVGILFEFKFKYQLKFKKCRQYYLSIRFTLCFNVNWN